MVGVGEFIQQYFIDPVIYDQPYNVYNTLVYALILIAAAYGVFQLLQKWKVKIDKNFILAVLPFVIFGSAFRTWEDAGIITNPFFVTPGSYIITFGLVMLGLGAGIVFEKYRKIPYYKTMMYFGAALAIASLLVFRINNWFGFLATLAIFGAWVALIYYMDKFILKVGKLGSYAIMAHLFDASATFVALTWFSDKYGEQHVLPAFLISVFGPASFFILKLALIVPIVWLISKQTGENERDWRNYLLLLVLILGLAPGLRDLLRLTMFV